MNITQIYQIINGLLGDRAAELNHHIRNSLPNFGGIPNGGAIVEIGFGEVEDYIRNGLQRMGFQPGAIDGTINQIMAIGNINGPRTPIIIN